MATAEPRPSPRATTEEEDALILARYGVMPNPGNQIKTPRSDNIIDWTPTPVPDPEPPAPTPSVLTVFGGKGFIGRDFLKKAASSFEEVRVVSRSSTPIPGLEGNVKYLNGDVTDVESVYDAVTGAGTVVNLVGILYETSTSSFFKVHYEGAKNVAYACRANGVANLVHMSALGSSDDSACKYQQSKGWGEGVVRECFPEATIIRPSIVFGKDDAFFNRFANFPLPFLPLVGGGTTKFQPVHVDDVAEALAKCATSEVGKSMTVDCCGPETKSFKELMQQMQELTGSKKPLIPVPTLLAEVQGGLMQFMSEPMVTRDQVLALQYDNVAQGENSSLMDLGIEPVTLGKILPTYIK
jgi:NADH dehydrogenase